MPATPALASAKSSPSRKGAAFAHNFSSDASPVRVIIVGPSSAARAAARSVPSRSTRIRRAIPRDASCIALARPMPDAAPVTSADLPVKSSDIISLSQLGLNRPQRRKAHHLVRYDHALAGPLLANQLAVRRRYLFIFPP